MEPSKNWDERYLRYLMAELAHITGGKDDETFNKTLEEKQRALSDLMETRLYPSMRHAIVTKIELIEKSIAEDKMCGEPRYSNALAWLGRLKADLTCSWEFRAAGKQKI